ncbi:hypothetical protein SLNSH_21040 [Alsobacter soli]|uniref:Flagellar motor switch protein FliN-like C-terminal domain-containing protein n=1 Tax=Alsobacter soli TaxID=2109933 RepID=A0A2T1HN42_9HYPH|nr:hypothetical protein SLNSH_21040 [Alsobacter soli]
MLSLHWTRGGGQEAPRLSIYAPRTAASTSAPIRIRFRVSVERRVASGLDIVGVDISIVLGRSRMPIHQLLRMGRGAVIALDSAEGDEVEILANDMPIAKGTVVVSGTVITVEVKELLRRPGSEKLSA